MKICVLICSHSNPIFTKLTIKSLRENCRNHELDIHVGIHSNYSDYTSDFSLIHEFKNCHFHLIDEIDWFEHNADVYRYSKMHVKNLENLFKNIRYSDFDCVLILDNDLYIKEDFISKYYNNEDLLTCLHDDRIENIDVLDEYNRMITFAPKPTIWHTIISRKTYDNIMRDTSILYPNFVDNIFFDTFARVYDNAEKWNLNVKIFKSSDFQNSIEHFFGSSFNYGSRIRNEESQKKLLEKVDKIYSTYD